MEAREAGRVWRACLLCPELGGTRNTERGKTETGEMGETGQTVKSRSNGKCGGTPQTQKRFCGEGGYDRPVLH